MSCCFQFLGLSLVVANSLPHLSPVAQTLWWFMWVHGHITHWMATLAYVCVYQCRIPQWHDRETLVYNRQSSTRTSLTELYPMEHLVFVCLMDEPGLRDKVFKGIAKPAIPVSPRKRKKWKNLKNSSKHHAASMVINSVSDRNLYQLKMHCSTEKEDL